MQVVKKGEEGAILEEAHGGKLGGHSGVNKTTDCIKIRYWWPGFTDDIKNFVSLVRVHCKTLQGLFNKFLENFLCPLPNGGGDILFLPCLLVGWFVGWVASNFNIDHNFLTIAGT